MYAMLPFALALKRDSYQVADSRVVYQKLKYSDLRAKTRTVPTTGSLARSFNPASLFSL